MEQKELDLILTNLTNNILKIKKEIQEMGQCLADLQKEIDEIS